MPAKIFLLSRKADKQLKKLPFRIHNQARTAFTKLKINPISGVKLEGELEELYKFRIGDYRIVYRFDPKESKLEILKIEHRQGVYR